MTDEQKVILSNLTDNNHFNIFQNIDFIRQNVYPANGNFNLEYNAKSGFWILKGRFIGVITKEFDHENFISASSLPLLQTKLLRQLKLYLGNQVMKMDINEEKI